MDKTSGSAEIPEGQPARTRRGDFDLALLAGELEGQLQWLFPRLQTVSLRRWNNDRATGESLDLRLDSRAIDQGELAGRLSAGREAEHQWNEQGVSPLSHARILPVHSNSCGAGIKFATGVGMKHSTLYFSILALTTLGLVLAPRLVFACGGFFCSAVQVEPVEQNAERILFEVNGDVVTATVEIKYSGEPEGFAWVVPTSAQSSDELNLEVEVPGDVLALLDDVTAPAIIPPPSECGSNFRSGGAVGMMADFGAESAPTDDAVDVEDLPQVGPYEPQLVSSDDPDALVAWLNENDYLITPEMEPFVADYVAQGKKFLAMKLAPGSEVADVAPISMSYAGSTPTIDAPSLAWPNPP